MRIDLEAVLALVDAAGGLAGRLDGTEVGVDVELGRGRKADPAKAVLSRDLLYLQQLLTLAAAEVGMRYYELKGQVDPRLEEAAESPWGPWPAPDGVGERDPQEERRVLLDDGPGPAA